MEKHPNHGYNGRFLYRYGIPNATDKSLSLGRFGINSPFMVGLAYSNNDLFLRTNMKISIKIPINLTPEQLILLLTLILFLMLRGC